MDAQTILQATKKIKNTILEHRKILHACPEVGHHLPNTTAYVLSQLQRMGYQPKQICDSGIVATITGGNSENCILLRADMDALPITEKTNLSFQSTNNAMHACGHDMHTAMLLGAAEILQQFRSHLNGTVKLVFQPDEEGFTGAKAMIKSGVLENPTPSTGIALHVHSGTHSNLLLCGQGTIMAGCTVFRITVAGVGCHGAMPETGVDPINIATHIYSSLQSIACREISPKASVAITIGKFYSGQAPNVIPSEAILEGTIRSLDADLTALIVTRIKNISNAIAEAFRGSASFEELSSVPPLKNDSKLLAKIKTYASQILGSEQIIELTESGMGSEDFSVYTHQIPCCYLLLGAGDNRENPLFGSPMHNEKTIFNEEILTTGTALEAYCVLKWLKEQAD